MTSLIKLHEDIRLNKPRPLIVAAIPAYNEERTIAKTVLEAQKHVELVVVCDDGSSDMTGLIAERLGAEVIRHKENLGYGAAIKSLFKLAREIKADIMVTLDGDGQHNPQDIPVVLEPVLDKKADIVIGSRFLDTNGTKDIPRYRRLGINLLTKLTGAASNQTLTDSQCGLRVYGRKALESLSLSESGMGVSVETIIEASRQGLTVAEVPTGCTYQGLERTSTQNPLGHAVGVFMSIFRLIVEKKPLTILGLPGTIFLFAGVGFGIWMLKIFTERQQIITNIALASIAFVLLGMFTIFTAITLYAISRLYSKNGN